MLIIDVVLAYDQKDLYQRHGGWSPASHDPNQSLVFCYQQKSSDWSCHRNLIDGQRWQWTAGERNLDKADGACVHEDVVFFFLCRKTVFLLGILKPHKIHYFRLFSIAAMINPSLRPWGMAGGMIISLRSKAANSSLWVLSSTILDRFSERFG